MKPIDILRQLSFEEKKRKYPTFPENHIPVTKYSDSTHNGLQKCIKDFLELSGWQCERKSTTGRQIDKRKIVKDYLGRSYSVGSIEWIPGTGRKGSADLSSTIKNKAGYGISVKWECKVGKDYQKKDQKEYQIEIESAGGKYFVVHSFEEFYKYYLEVINS
jgi:hypothetical protein